VTTPKGQRAAREIGTDPVRQWHGIYLARVVRNRAADSWLQLQVPQVLGMAVSNWAAPAGAEDNGTGPVPGTIVLAMFLGGDIDQPLYMLTSQHLR
jgi:hypothetical protein